MARLTFFSELRDGAGRSLPGLRGVIRSFAVVLFLLPAACAMKSDVRDLQEEIRELNQQNQLLLEQLGEELARSQDTQSDSLRALARSVQEFRAESARRFTNVEDNLLLAVELAGVSQQQLATLRDQLEQDRARAAFQGAFDPGADGEPSAEGVRETYEAAMTQFRRGAYSAARMGLREVVERHPNHELAPEARFYLADILVQEGDLERAIQQFLEVREFHPDHPQVPSALYRVGLLHMELGEGEEAEDYLERVVNTWPDSDAAELAREALERLE